MKRRFQLIAASVCHSGKVRTYNEDNLLFEQKFLPEIHPGIVEDFWTMKGSTAIPQLFGVFDGMGGLKHGEKASYLTALEISNALKKQDISLIPAAEFLHDICIRANQTVCEEGKRKGALLGTTAAMLYFQNEMVVVCNIGDSPIYCLRNGKLEAIFQEHTERAMYKRLMGSEKADNRKFPLTQHIGIPEQEMQIEPYTSEQSVKAGDIYLICSDGLSDMVSEKTIIDILQNQKKARRAAIELREEALKNGGKDNITAIVIQIVERKWLSIL